MVLSTYAGDVQVLRAIKAGARGYLLKGNVRTQLLEAIRTIHAGRKRIPPEIAAELADHAADDQLSSREIDVLSLIGEGNANKQIADKLSIAETTVKNHISNILSKLGANDRAHAVTIALQRGIIELEAPIAAYTRAHTERQLRSKFFGSEGVRMASRRSLLRCLGWTGCVILGAICLLVLSAAQACNKTNQAAPEMVLTIIDQSWLDKPSQALLSEELKQFTLETGIRVQVRQRRKWR